MSNAINNLKKQVESGAQDKSKVMTALSNLKNDIGEDKQHLQVVRTNAQATIRFDMTSEKQEQLHSNQDSFSSLVALRFKRMQEEKKKSDAIQANQQSFDAINKKPNKSKSKLRNPLDTIIRK